MCKIEKVNYSEEMQSAYISYAMSVITDRALPDVRDGLKPVHRRILYSMFEDGCTYNNSPNKCAAIVGNVLGRYHPHGDTAVYDAMVRMAQDFLLRYPFVDGDGNFGSIDGDGAAAYRYTEAKLRKLATLATDMVEFGVVDMRPSYNERYSEPIVLPMLFPNLLVNGVSGIAVGMTTNIPTHNLSNVIDTTIAFMNKPKTSTQELLDILVGPDFPTGGVVSNKKDLLAIYETGLGDIKIKGKHVIEDNKIVITEIPYTMSGKQAKLVESIIKLAQTKKELQIISVSDESSMEGIRIVIECRKSMSLKTVVDYLYKFTPYSDTFGVYFLCLVDGAPRTLSLKEYLEKFVEFQKEIYTRKFKYILDKNTKTIERLEGLVLAYDVVDAIIAVMKYIPNNPDRIKIMMTGEIEDIPAISKSIKSQIKKFRFTEFQAQCILELKLKNLSNLVKAEIEAQTKKLISENLKISVILSSEKKLMNEIKAALLNIKSEFGDKRKTIIKNETNEFVAMQENFTCFVKDGYLKRFKSDDSSKLYDKVLAVTADGGVFIIRDKDIPLCTPKDKGIAAENFSKKPVVSCFVFETDVMFITEGGYGKVVDKSEFEVSRSSLKGFLNDTDRVIYAGPTCKKITVVMENGKSKVLDVKSFVKASRTAKGNKISPQRIVEVKNE